MRPEKLHYLTNKAFNYYLDTKSIEKFKLLLPALIKLYKRCATEEDDFRAGGELGGYNKEDNYYEMLYISDRWCCAHRLSWLIDGITTGEL